MLDRPVPKTRSGGPPRGRLLLVAALAGPSAFAPSTPRRVPRRTPRSPLRARAWSSSSPSTRCTPTTWRASPPSIQGGFKRFNEQGAVFSNAYYRHANSETGPGHSVLLSGRHARDTGIVANEWYDRLDGARSTSWTIPRLVAASRARPGRLARPLHRPDARRPPEEGLAGLARGGRLDEGPLGDPHGRSARRRGLLVRARVGAASGAAPTTCRSFPPG